MLEGEPSAQSEVLSPVEQVFIEDISVLCTLQTQCSTTEPQEHPAGDEQS